MSADRNPEIQKLLANLRAATSGSGSFAAPDSRKSLETQRQQPFDVQDRSRSIIPKLELFPDQDEPRSSSQVVGARAAPPQRDPASLTVNILKDRSVTPVIPDASSITTWPAALKYTMKQIATNDKTVTKIKHLISEQHKHERQWWAGREAIVARHSGRQTNQQKAADLLKSLGGLHVPVKAADPQADQAELELYDKKVYKGLTDMAADFDRQFRAIGIPFFAIKHDLVILEEGLGKDGNQQGRVDKGELRMLQTKMVQTLEDLFRND